MKCIGRRDPVPELILSEGRACGGACGGLPSSDAGMLRYAPIREPRLDHEIVLATTAQLALPREFCVRVGEIIRGQAAQLIDAGAWQAELRSPEPWEPLRL